LGPGLLARIPESHKEWMRAGGVRSMVADADVVSMLDMLPQSKSLSQREPFQMPIENRQELGNGLSRRHTVAGYLGIMGGYALKSHTDRGRLREAVRRVYPGSGAVKGPSLSTLSTPEVSHGSASGNHRRNASAMGRLDRNANRTVVFGHGPVAQQVYEGAARDLGPNNVRWVHALPSASERSRIGRDFGATSIRMVRHDAWREVTRRGITRRMPYNPIPGVLASTTGPGKRGGRGGGITRPPSWKAPGSQGRPRPEPQPRPGGGPRWTPPSTPNGRWSQPRVGGVMLSGSADVQGGSEDISLGSFSLVFDNGEATMDVQELREFVTALWAVYFSAEGPGISIDPIAPDVDKHLVRYIGQVVNSDLGAVMREADYLMKRWTVGTERADDIPGFQNPDDIAGRRGRISGNTRSRFWFVPADMTFRRAGNLLTFEHGRMTLRTEYDMGSARKGTDPANEEFARWFTENYEVISARYPIFEQLSSYARMVSLARHLKESGVPLLWYLLANKDLILTEDSPGTVDAFATRSKHFDHIEISGGVDLVASPSDIHYVIDHEAEVALRDATRMKAAASVGRGAEPMRIERGAGQPADLSLCDSQDLALSSGNVEGDVYQTDLLIRNGGAPLLEMTRYYDPGHEGTQTFGPGWNLMIPYGVEPADDTMIPWGEHRVPERMIVKNLLTGDRQILSFDEDRFSVAGWVPENAEDSGALGLFLLTDTSYRLVDKVGSEFQFDPAGRLTDMIFTEEHVVHFEYERTSLDWQSAGARLAPLGAVRVEHAGILLPKHLALYGPGGDQREVFVFAPDNAYGVLGYLPENPESPFEVLAALTDGGFQLQDQCGAQRLFDATGELSCIETTLVTSMSRGDHEIEFRYEPDGVQGLRIRAASFQSTDGSEKSSTIGYSYASDGRLCSVLKSNGDLLQVRYEEDRVFLAVND
jgi:hypothetical protein